MAAPQFDYIIIGAGVGGLVVASRLSEDADITVLLIEAGSDGTGDARIETPGLLTTLYGDPEVDWDFMSEPQVHVRDRQIPQPRGRVLGGSSALNFSLVMYPSRQDFEAWTALGNEGWRPEEMAPYLRKFHTYATPDDTTAELLALDRYMENSQQGDHGPLPISFPAVYGPYNKAWDDTFAALGWQDTLDPISGGKKEGAFTCPLSVDVAKGTRGYATAYYSPEVAARPNLSVWTATRAEKILFSDNNDGKLKGTGVQIDGRNGSTVVTAKREVILSAGSLQSPQLLELSGIGGAERLQQHGIPVQRDLPGVGENLQDHCITALSYKVVDGQVSADVMRDPQVVQSLLQLYRETKGGPLAGIPVSVAYLPFVNGDGEVQKEEIRQLLDKYLTENQHGHTVPGKEEQTQLLRQMLLDGQGATAEYMFLPLQLHVKPGPTTMAELFEKKSEGNYISIIAMLSHPFSRGSVHIKSSDIQDKPSYDPNYLAHPLDLEVLARHTQYIEKIVRTEPFQSLVQTDSRIPEAGDADLADLDTAKRTVRERLFSCFHPAGTCAMMPAEKGGVVDPQLRVHGTHNLRVVDASIFPLEPQANPQATLYAVAEKAADLIKQDVKLG